MAAGPVVSTRPAPSSTGRQVRSVLTGLLLLGLLVQVYLAGRGVFGASDYDTHESLGYMLHGVTLLLLVVSVVFRETRNRVDVGLPAVLFVLTTVQMMIASFDHPEIAAFHPVNALLIVGATAGLLARDRRLSSATP